MKNPKKKKTVKANLVKAKLTLRSAESSLHEEILAWEETFDEEDQEIVNQAMMNIAKDILAGKF